MGAICNGIALHSPGLIPYCATFFVFTDYMRGAMRISALSEAGVIYVMTHDSIGLGEDGPTHQPIEHIASFRAMPNTPALVAAGITGSLVLLVVSDLFGAALFAALNAAPVALLVRQALLARRLPDGSYSWYPPGLLTAWLTGYALAGMGVAMLLLGGPEAMHDSLRKVLATVLDRMYGARVPNQHHLSKWSGT